MKTVTICGSMRFAQEMRDIAWNLETCYGFNVLQCVYTPNGAGLTEMQRTMLTKAHYRKIDLSDAIYVVDIGEYVGESVRQEISYAKAKGKTVIFHREFEGG